MGTLAFSLLGLLLWALGLQRLARDVAARSDADLDSHTENMTDASSEEQ